MEVETVNTKTDERLYSMLIRSTDSGARLLRFKSWLYLELVTSSLASLCLYFSPI